MLKSAKCAGVFVAFWHEICAGIIGRDLFANFAWSGSMDDGIRMELEGIDPGDKRLNRRSERIIESLAANTQASVNSACDGWNETMVANRFFDNQVAEPARISQPHGDAT